MFSNNKTLRYYYWISKEFVKKHLKLILLSFLLSIIGIISIISFSPFLISFTSAKKTTIGMVGNYDSENMPETVLSKMSSGLLFTNEKGMVVPVLVDKWTESKDEKTYHFTLKKNLAWNDGKPFTTKGFIFSELFIPIIFCP